MKIKKTPSTFISISCIAVLLAIIVIGNGIFSISIQPLLIFATFYVSLVGIYLGYTWKDMQKAIAEKLEKSMPTMFIIIIVGVVVATWIYSGTVPMLIYYGLKLINPRFFLVSAFIIVAIVSVATGTAWGSTATAGVALMGIGVEMGIPAGMVAGAVIAGGVFGDKLSPLSDTTNLASMTCDVDLFEHIKWMLYTTIPSSIIGVIVYFIVGINFSGTVDSISINEMLVSLEKIYNFNCFMLIPIAIVLIGSIMKKPTVPLMFISSIVAVIIGSISNGFSVVDGVNCMLNGFNISMANISLDDIIPQVVTLLERGGMKSMMVIIITIFCGYAYAGVLEVTGALHVILGLLYNKINKVWKLVGITILSSALLVFTAGVASISIIIVGSLLKGIYDRMGLKMKNLSRTLEDAGTMLLPFVPWGASGVFYAQVLGVQVKDYWIWAISCYLCIVFAMIYAVSGRKIERS